MITWILTRAGGYVIKIKLMKNKLTLKSLQQELESLKVKAGVKTANTTKGAVGQDIKHSYINNLHMKGSALWLYIITGVLGYAHKIPIIGRILTLAGLWYGKTTIWKILVLFRKVFIVVNAVIGVYMVFKTAGFSSENLIVGWLAVGETYFQTLAGLTGKLFRWFVELFDHKIVPNVPGDNGGTWFSKPKVIENKSIFVPSNLNISDIIENKPFSLRDLYKDGIISNSNPWYTDKTTWYWIAGTACTLGFIYFSYKLYNDPLYIFDIFKSNPSIQTTGATPPINPADNMSGPSDYSLPPSPDITLGKNAANTVSMVTKGFVSAYKSTTRALNPFNWFPVAADIQSKLNCFLDVQYDYNRADRTLFPFTENNPFDSWTTKLRKAYIGESSQEFLERTQLKMYADRIYESIRVTKGKAIDFGGVSPALSLWSGQNTPGYITPTVAVGLHPSTSTIVDHVNAAMVNAKLSTLSPTPSVVPTAAWAEHVIEKDDFEVVKRWKSVRPGTSGSLFNKPATISEVVGGIEKHENKFSIFSSD